MLWVKAFGVWLVMLVAAFLNGALRALLIVLYVGEPLGHVLSPKFRVFTEKARTPQTMISPVK
jgi:hypothetical protein